MGSTQERKTLVEQEGYERAVSLMLAARFFLVITFIMDDAESLSSPMAVTLLSVLLMGKDDDC